MSQTGQGAPYPEGTDKVRDGDNAIKSLATWASYDMIKKGRVDRQIEGNGYLRIHSAECWFTNGQPGVIVAMGINEQFRPTWDGTADGGGVLLKVYKTDNTQYPPGAGVAIYWTAYRGNA